MASASRSAKSSREGGLPVRDCSEAQQQPDGVAVGGDGVRAGLALLEQPVGEERLQGGGERGHRGSTFPIIGSSRSAASASSSGAADRYQ